MSSGGGGASFGESLNTAWWLVLPLSWMVGQLVEGRIRHRPLPDVVFISGRLRLVALIVAVCSIALA